MQDSFRRCSTVVVPPLQEARCLRSKGHLLAMEVVTFSLEVVATEVVLLERVPWY